MPSVLKSLFKVPVLILLMAMVLPLPFTEAAWARTATRLDQSAVRHGGYLVALLGCGRCHTEGYLTGGSPTGPALAGSEIGIAYSRYKGTDDRPGVAYPRNLTSDPETGLGRWSVDEIASAIRSGIGKDDYHTLPVMPSANYSLLKDKDLHAIASYLKSLPPVVRSIPVRVAPGTPAMHPYVRFGVYIFAPGDHTAAMGGPPH